MISKILFTSPLSIVFEKIFFSIIKIIGPAKSPINPKNLNPVYIAIKVKIGCMPILLLTIFGSMNCFASSVNIYKPKSAEPKDISEFIKEIIAQGISTVPLPKYWKRIHKSNN